MLNTNLHVAIFVASANYGIAPIQWNPMAYKILVQERRLGSNDAREKKGIT